MGLFSLVLTVLATSCGEPATLGPPGQRAGQAGSGATGGSSHGGKGGTGQGGTKGESNEGGQREPGVGGTAAGAAAEGPGPSHAGESGTGAHGTGDGTAGRDAAGGTGAAGGTTAVGDAGEGGNGGGEAGDGNAAGADGGGTKTSTCPKTPTPESCNGIDDDCDGYADNLGTFTCGIGACQKRVVACQDGTVQSCVPKMPASGPDGCDGVDNDCDGAVDEDCGCFHVTTGGDDAAAAASAGATPFASVQAAIDYAAVHREVTTRVCVAGGTTCGTTATYAGPDGAELEMADGIDVFGDYESTSWTRCGGTSPTTTLAPATSRGVVFASSITTPTVLDGFAVTRMNAAIVAGVTMDGARGAAVSNLTIPPMVTESDESYGVNLINGAEGRVSASTIDGGSGLISAAVRAQHARVDIEDNCPDAFDADGRCHPNDCSTPGPKLTGSSGTTVSPDTRAGAQDDVIVLDDAAGSRIERSAICGSRLQGSLVRVTGDARGVLVRANHLDTTTGPTDLGAFHALSLTNCGGATPWIVANPTLGLISDAVWGPVGSEDTSTLYAGGNCHPVVEANPAISVVTRNHGSATGVECAELGEASSRCVLTNNTITADFDSTSQVISGIVVHCTNACGRIDHNVLTGPGCEDCGGNATGLELEGGSATVDSNFIVGGGGDVSAQGIEANAPAARVENNEIYGAYTIPCSLFGGCGNGLPGVTYSATGFYGVANVSSNFISAYGSSPAPVHSGAGSLDCRGYGLYLGAGGTFRNNILSGGGCGTPVLRHTADRNADVFENNDVYNGDPSGSPLLLCGAGLVGGTPDGTGSCLHSVADIEAMPELHASGTLDVACPFTSDRHLPAGSPCIDAGSPTDAPLADRDGDLRDAQPDVGFDEYLP